MVDGKNQFSLCEACAARQGTELTDFRLVNDKSCTICHGLTSRIAAVEEKVIRRAKRYHFGTFSVGMILPSGVQEREDQLRSSLRIRGRITIKSELTGEIVDFMVRRMHRKLDRLHPDLTVLVNLSNCTVNFACKSIFIYGRYTKPRGVSQRRTLCERCWGRGCDACDSGYGKNPSIEKSIGDRFSKLLRSPKIKFTWLGSEDPESVVFPPGRPFVAEAKNPMKQRIPARIAVRTGAGTVKVTGLRRLRGRPSSIPAFAFRTRAYVQSELPVRVKTSELNNIRNSMVQYKNNKGKVVNKMVHQLRILTARGRKLTVEIKLDGGLPVKRFVNGDCVSPSLSEIFGTPLICQRFDILRVWESGGFEFGKV